MNTYNEYSIDDLIHLFLDRQTSPDQQAYLFESLAVEKENQSKFQQAIEIKRSFVSDKNSLYPPAELTSSLFVKAGFNPPIGQSTQATDPMPVSTTAPSATAGIPIMSRLWHYFLPALAGSAITAALILSTSLFRVSDNNNQLNNTAAKSEKTGGSLNSIDSRSNLPVVSSTETTTVAKPKQFTVIKYVYVNVPEKNENSKAANEAKTTTESDNQSVGPMLTVSKLYRETSPNIGNNLNENPGSGFRSLSGNDLLSQLQFENEKKFWLELNGVDGLAYAPYRQYLSAGTSINNFSLKLAYKLNSYVDLGMAFGKEAFQMYDVTNERGVLAFASSPDQLWGGAFMRWTPADLRLFNQFNPYAEVDLGMTKYGAMGKGIVGLSYTPVGMLSFNLGVEGTGLTYQLLGSTKSTEKISIIYGLAMHF